MVATAAPGSLAAARLAARRSFAVDGVVAAAPESAGPVGSEPLADAALVVEVVEVAMALSAARFAARRSLALVGATGAADNGIEGVLLTDVESPLFASSLLLPLLLLLSWSLLPLSLPGDCWAFRFAALLSFAFMPPGVTTAAALALAPSAVGAMNYDGVYTWCDVENCAGNSCSHSSRTLRRAVPLLLVYSRKGRGNPNRVAAVAAVCSTHAFSPARIRRTTV